MSYFIGIILGLAGLLVAILVWNSLPTDGIGRARRLRREEAGLQGRLTEWLYWDATLQSPRVKNIDAPNQERLNRVGDRALWSVLARLQTERQVSMDEARRLLRNEVHHGAARAFLDGNMRRAMRLHWWRRYTGPAFLFIAWYYLVAMVRYGRRHLYLETLSAVLQELRKT